MATKKTHKPLVKHNPKTHNPKTGKPHSEKKKKKIANILQKGKEAALITLFLPFQIIGRSYLKQKGVTPAKTTRELIVQLHNETQKKSFGFNTGSDDSFNFGDTAAELGYLEGFGYTVEQYGLLPVTPEMVNAVIIFLKNIFDKIGQKKAKGEKLTPAEQTIADAAPQIEKEIEAAKLDAAKQDATAQENAAKEALAPEGSINIGGMMVSPKMMIGFILLILIIIFLVSKR